MIPDTDEVFEAHWDGVVASHTMNDDPYHNLEVLQRRMKGCLDRGQFDRTEIERWLYALTFPIMSTVLTLKESQSKSPTISDEPLPGSQSEQWEFRPPSGYPTRVAKAMHGECPRKTPDGIGSCDLLDGHVGPHVFVGRIDPYAPLLCRALEVSTTEDGIIVMTCRCGFMREFTYTSAHATVLRKWLKKTAKEHDAIPTDKRKGIH